ncbi:hypothetical protein [Bosea sp. (in: a-proteobacteria)]|uniref:hypothetical protein n=1 Tax=Bosea sp. (in: a-proteobacteria) TaxID=1871050 RepID=UPI0026257C15|nr:hypothetical protein [Bosea sp. (in: a-proteobacteria)]MCO5092404.1 hypothetical protein [Bosea sp. (in: a-proteobacteria)]
METDDKSMFQKPQAIFSGNVIAEPPWAVRTIAESFPAGATIVIRARAAGANPEPTTG